jgi:hypothetical protein
MKNPNDILKIAIEHLRQDIKGACRGGLGLDLNDEEINAFFYILVYKKDFYQTIFNMIMIHDSTSVGIMKQIKEILIK